MPSLNSSQRAAVTHIGSPLLVLAGAGSGKTRVITERICWLINHREVPPENITALTFTNKAAREMKQRVGDMMPNPDSIKGLQISTFHALGMRMMRSQPRQYNLKSGFTIVDYRDCLAIVAELLKTSLGSDNTLIERVLRSISGFKNSGVSQVSTTDASPPDTLAIELFDKYQHYLSVCNAVDLDDLVYLPTLRLSEDPSLLKSWRLKIRYLMVDEYQDTNGIQYQLVKLLTDDGKRLCVVGDDDQSIYAWRGAQPENLLQLKEDFHDLEVIKLEQNYRSCNRVLKAANELIKNNARPFEKSLWSELGLGDPIKVIDAENEEQEAEKVVSEILKGQFQYNAPFSDFAILYRSNHQSRILEIKCREMRIPYKISGGNSFFERTEIRDIMAYLRLITNPSDDAAFLRIINTPRRGVGPNSLEKIAQLASDKQLPMLETLDDIELRSIIKPKVMSSLQDFYNLIHDLHQDMDTVHGDTLLEKLLKNISYENWLLQTSSVESAELRWQNILLLKQWIADAIQPHETHKTLSDILSDLIVSDLLDRQEQDKEDNVVNLMTLHAAKGLEFKRVFIVGVEEDILPHKVSLEENSLQEERRLFYVGITRAMGNLTLSYPRKRKRFGEWQNCEPSRFLEELPAEDLKREDEGEISEEEQTLTARSHLANLRASRKLSGTA